MYKKLVLINIEYDSEGEGERIFSSILNYPYKVEYSASMYYEQVDIVEKMRFTNSEEYNAFMELLSNAIFTKDKTEVISLAEEENLKNKCAYNFNESYTICALYETPSKSLKMYRKKFYCSMLDNKQYRLIRILKSLPWKISMIGRK